MACCPGITRPVGSRYPDDPNGDFRVAAVRLQGMARGRSGQAPAWPLASDRRGCRGSDAQGVGPKDAFCEAVLERILGCPLMVEGHPPDTVRAIPGSWLRRCSASSRPGVAVDQVVTVDLALCH